MDSQRKYKSENNAKKQIKIDENSGTYREWILTIIHSNLRLLTLMGKFPRYELGRFMDNSSNQNK